MPDYRIYKITDHRLAGPPEVVSVPTDAEAIEHAERLGIVEHDIEIWQGARFVGAIYRAR